MLLDIYLSLVYRALVVIAIIPKCSLCTWDFTSVGLTNDLPIWKFAIWRNRVFFAVPSVGRRENDVNNVFTLLEAHWPEPEHKNQSLVAGTTDLNDKVRVFPKSSAHDNCCLGLVSVVGLDVDPRGRLWILDSSSENTNCSAKIVVYDLRRNNEIVRIEMKGIKKGKLRTLVVDPYNGFFGPRAYIGDPDDGSIIVFNLNKKILWRLKILKNDRMLNFGNMEIAISKKDQLLYVTDSRSDDLFSLDLAATRIKEAELLTAEKKDLEHNVTLNWLGKKMGISSGLVIDQKDGLHYFLVTEHASVRWDTRNDLNVSSYSILLQSVEVPCITDYRLDSQKNVWGLVNLENPFVKNANSVYHDHWKARFRTVRVFKHNFLSP